MMQFFRKHVRSIMLVIVVLFVVSCFSMYGFSGGGNQGTADRTVAKINGKSIKLSRLETEMAQMIKAMNLESKVTSHDYPLLRKEVLDSIAFTAEVENEIKSHKIAVTKTEIEDDLKKIIASFPTVEIFKEQLKSVGKTEDDLKKDIEKQIKERKLIEQITAEASVDEKEVRDFFDKLEKENLKIQEGIKLNIASFKTQESAEKARKDIDSGKKWDDVMEGASADLNQHTPYDAQSFVPMDGFQGNLEPVKTMALNKISKVIKIAEGNYAVIMNRSHQKAGYATFDDVSADIKGNLWGQKKQAKLNEFTQELKNKSKIEILEKELFEAPAPVSEEKEPVMEDASADETEKKE